MADFLNFKKGLAAGLQTATKKAGTVYVTTDERAMYVDISDTERIRLGDFIVAASLEALSTVAYQPYSTTALYYIEKENALARYDGSKWVQINDTAALQSAINGLTTQVSGLDAVVNGTAAVEGGEKTGGLVQKVATNEQDIKDLQDAIDELAGGETGDSLSGLSGRISALETAVGKEAEGETAASGLIADVRAAEADIDDLQARMAVEEAATVSHGNRIKALEDADFGKQISDAQTTLQTNIDAVDDKADKNAEDIRGISGDLDTLEGTVSGHTTTLGEHDTRITAAQTRADNAYALAETAKANAKTAQDEVNAVELKVEALESTVNSEVHGNVKLKELIGSLDSELEQLTATVGTNKTNAETGIGEAKAAAKAAQDDVDALEQTVEAINGAYLSKTEAASTYVTTVDANKNYAAKSLENTVTTLSSDFKTFSETTVPETYATKTELNTFIDTTAPATYVKKTDAFTKETADGLYYGKTAGENLANTVAGHTTELAKKVDNTLKINGQELKSDITITKVAEADKATQDGEGNVISTTYLKAADAFTKAAADELYAAKGIETTVSTQGQTIAQHGEDIAELVGVIGKDKDGDTAATGLYATMDSKINAAIAKNDAMTFMGVVNSNDDLPATANKGDTYKVGTTGSYAGQTCLIGDLIINNGADGAAAEWVIVPSGGEDYNDPQLATDADTDTVALKNFAGNKTLGSVQFVGGEGVQIDTTSTTTDGVNAGVVTVNMVWGTF